MKRATLTLAVVVPLLLVVGCGGSERASSSPTRTITVTASPGADESAPATSGDDRHFATALTLRGVCDNLAYTFRTGDQTPLENWRYLSTMLQGVSDVSQPPAKRALQPMIDAATAGAVAGKRAGDDVYSNRFNAGYEQLDKTSQALGSEGLDQQQVAVVAACATAVVRRRRRRRRPRPERRGRSG